MDDSKDGNNLSSMNLTGSVNMHIHSKQIDDA